MYEVCNNNYFLKKTFVLLNKNLFMTMQFYYSEEQRSIKQFKLSKTLLIFIWQGAVKDFKEIVKRSRQTL